MNVSTPTRMYERQRRWKKGKGKEIRTSCFFSSTLSETMSLVADARVDRFASVFPFATSVSCQTVVSVAAGSMEGVF